MNKRQVRFELISSPLSRSIRRQCRLVRSSRRLLSTQLRLLWARCHRL